MKSLRQKFTKSLGWLLCWTLAAPLSFAQYTVPYPSHKKASGGAGPYTENFNCTQNPLTGCSTAAAWTAITGGGTWTSVPAANGSAVVCSTSGQCAAAYSLGSATFGANQYGQIVPTGAGSSMCLPIVRADKTGATITFYWIEVSVTPSVFFYRYSSGSNTQIGSSQPITSQPTGHTIKFSVAGTGTSTVLTYTDVTSGLAGDIVSVTDSGGGALNSGVPGVHCESTSTPADNWQGQ